MRVSVITPAYNAQKYLAQTLDSVFAQTLPDWELIIVDDGSSDSTSSIAESYAARDPRFQVLRQQNRGAENARNSGFALCSPESRFLLFLDSDDCLVPNALETLTKYLEERPEVGMVYCSLEIIDGSGRPVGEAGWCRESMRFVPSPFGLRRLPDSEPETPMEALASYFQAIPSCCLFRRSIFEKTAGWDELFRVSARSDNDMGLKCVLLAPVHFLPVPLTQYRRHGENISLHSTARDAGSLERKWRTDPSLTPEQAARVRRALNFDHFVTSYLQFRGAREMAVSRQYAKATRLCLQGTKKMARFLILQMGRR